MRTPERASLAVVVACAAHFVIGADGSGVFETANHPFGGAVGVAVYATIVAATDDYGAAFAAAAGLAAAGGVVSLRARGSVIPPSGSGG